MAEHFGHKSTTQRKKILRKKKEIKKKKTSGKVGGGKLKKMFLTKLVANGRKNRDRWQTGFST